MISMQICNFAPLFVFSADLLDFMYFGPIAQLVRATDS